MKKKAAYALRSTTRIASRVRRQTPNDDSHESALCASPLGSMCASESAAARIPLFLFSLYFSSVVVARRERARERKLLACRLIWQLVVRVHAAARQACPCRTFAVDCSFCFFVGVVVEPYQTYEWPQLVPAPPMYIYMYIYVYTVQLINTVCEREAEAVKEVDEKKENELLFSSSSSPACVYLSGCCK